MKLYCYLSNVLLFVMSAIVGTLMWHVNMAQILQVIIGLLSLGGFALSLWLMFVQLPKIRFTI